MILTINWLVVVELLVLSPFVAAYKSQIREHIAGKPTVYSRRHVHDPPLYSRLLCRFNHCIHQQLC